jgi:arsenate reductase
MEFFSRKKIKTTSQKVIQFSTNTSYLIPIMSLKVYGIPNCGTCKKALNWLENNQIQYEFINIKEAPPTGEMIQSWMQVLGSKLMRNTSGQSYRALGKERENWTDEQWLGAFTKDAMLLKRPLFVKNRQAVLVGFKDKDESSRKKLFDNP